MTHTPHHKHNESDKQNGVDGEVSSVEASHARAHVGSGGPGSGPETESHLQKAEAADALVSGLENDPEIVPKTIEAIKNALSATQRYYNKHSKEWEILPDYRTSLAAAELVLKNIIGLPVQRVETKNHNITQTLTAEEAASPALLEALDRQRERVKRALDAKEKKVGPAE